MDKGLRFTTLWHHVYNIEQLRRSYFSLKRHAAPGLDEMTWQQYGEDLEVNLLDLSSRLQRGAYRAKPVKRTYVPKADGSQRPIGIPVLEDKIVQRAIRHIRKWLNAGVLEDGELTRAEEGTPQGGSISPLLANIYLHYVFDLWADKWRRQTGSGKVIFVRFADDIVAGFQRRSDAERFQGKLMERLKRFNLELHADKTRLIEFGRFAVENRKERGEGKPETFAFLGLTHIYGKTRKGKFTVLRQTMGEKMQRKLAELKQELRKRMHWSIPEIGEWLRTVLLGHDRYYGVPRNGRKLSAGNLLAGICAGGAGQPASLPRHTRQNLKMLKLT